MSIPVTKFYIDDSVPANYLGSWTFGGHCALTAGVPENAIEIQAPPPVHASQKTNDGGLTWTPYPEEE